ncbi:MAG: DUF547 domain-containing protein [Aggregatilineales bacterium]
MRELTVAHRLSYRLRRISPAEALNCAVDAPAAADINAESLKRAINAVVGSHDSAGKVNYEALRESVVFENFANQIAALRTFDPLSLESVNARKTFWINVYNALMIHAVIAYGVRRSIREVPAVFDRAAYVIAGHRYSANDIEHGVLRANAGSPLVPGPQFGKADPRRAQIMPSLDPRIHFALVCAARSCPPIGVYRIDQLDQQLDRAARHFINSGQLLLERATMTVKLSRLFAWYAADFGGRWFGLRDRSALVKFALGYLADEELRTFIEAHLDRLRVRFLNYDWTLNHAFIVDDHK